MFPGSYRVILPWWTTWSRSWPAICTRSFKSGSLAIWKVTPLPCRDAAVAAGGGARKCTA